MKNPIFPCALLLLLTATNTIAQNRTYIGIEASIANDIYELSDFGTELKTVPLIQQHFGINFSRDINKNLYLETGILRKNYDSGFGFKSVNGYGSSNAFNAWLFPVRIVSKINISTDRIVLTPIIGYLFCINSDYGFSGSGSGIQLSESDSINYRHTEDLNLAHTFSLLQTGLGIEFKVFKTATLSLSTNYYTGFNKVVQLDINYSMNESPEIAGKAYSKGEFWNVAASLKFPIDSLWQ